MGAGAVSLAVSRFSTDAAASQSPPEVDTDTVLGQIDARIEKYRKGEAVVRLIGPDGEALKGRPSVKITQTKHKFLFGCNIFRLNRCSTEQDSDAYAERFAELLNFATLPFYWWNYERRQGRPDDVRTEQILRWCKANNVTTKGHPLAWNWGQPPWLPDSLEEAMKLQFARIRRCVGKFKNDIDIWDVVNEATHYDRPHAKQYAPVLTEAIDKMGVGEYVRRAFTTAHEANPNATLIINDYRTDPPFEEKVISRLIDPDGKPMYDVIGIQSHMHGGYWGAERVWQVCERFARFAKPLHFTETTVVSGPKSPQGWLTTPEGEKRQAEQATQFYSVLFSHPAVEAITWWDFTDQGAWQAAPAGLVRADMSPKPVYERLYDLIKGKWWTQAEVAAEKGEAGFRGFFGQYKVAVRVDGRELTGVFCLDKTSERPIEVKLS